MKITNVGENTAQLAVEVSSGAFIITGPAVEHFVTLVPGATLAAGEHLATPPETTEPTP